MVVFCVQAEGGVRELVRCRGLGGVYKGQSERRGTDGREKREEVE